METDRPTPRPPTVESEGDGFHDAIRDQVRRILSHREFQATEKMREFLHFVVEESLAGRADQLKGYTIATQVFGRADDFDSAQDPVVRIQAGRLRRALERYYLIAGGRDPIRIDIPKGTYVPCFVVQGEEAEHEPAPIRTGAPSRSLPGPSVAVLPLDNLTGAPDQHFFAVGLAEELVTELNRFQDIVVMPCQRAALAFSSPVNVEQICRSAGARFLLGGSLRRDSQTVKVSMRLFDAQRGRQVWARAYKHPLDAARLIATQEEIARSVVAAIASEYGIIARRLAAESRKKPPADLDTYEAMLRYYTYQVSPSPEASRECFTALQRAVEREPEYAPAWSALATLHCQMYSFDVAGFDNPLDTALSQARRSVILEPSSQLGRLILAYASYLADDFDEFHREIEMALGLNPNSPWAVGTAGYFYVMVGEFDRGRSLLDASILVNPFHPRWFHLAYYADDFHGKDYDRALLEVEKYRPSQSFWFHVLHIAVLGKLGRSPEARVHIEKLTESKPDFPGRARELLGRSVKVENLIDELVDGMRKAGLEIH